MIKYHLPIDLKEFRSPDQRHSGHSVMWNADKSVATGFKIHWFKRRSEIVAERERNGDVRSIVRGE